MRYSNITPKHFIQIKSFFFEDFSLAKVVSKSKVQREWEKRLEQYDLAKKSFMNHKIVKKVK